MPTAVQSQIQQEEFIISGLKPLEIAAPRFSYTKPLGPTTQVVAIPAYASDPSFRAVAAGSELAVFEEYSLS